MPTKGFITVATGKEHYYKIALELLHTYRLSSKEPLPFAIFCDEENEYTKEFDDVRIYEKPTRSYLDKLEMFSMLPYDVNIFIDADCLVFNDINRLFDIFENSDDFCCFGRVLPLDDKTGWFEYDNLSDALKKQTDYVVGLHGGIYYMRKTELCKKVFDDARRFSENYAEYKFKGKFSTPGDEPVVALSMAVNKCKPILHDESALLCWWEYENGFKLDILKGVAFCKRNGVDTSIVHWGTRFTKSVPYLKQVALARAGISGKSPLYIDFIKAYYGVLGFINKINRLKNRILNKLGIAKRR